MKNALNAVLLAGFLVVCGSAAHAGSLEGVWCNSRVKWIDFKTDGTFGIAKKPGETKIYYDVNGKWKQNGNTVKITYTMPPYKSKYTGVIIPSGDSVRIDFTSDNKLSSMDSPMTIYRNKSCPN